MFSWLLGFIPRHGIVIWSYGDSMYNFFRNCQAYFQRGCTILSPHQCWMSVPMCCILASICYCRFYYSPLSGHAMEGNGYLAYLQGNSGAPDWRWPTPQADRMHAHSGPPLSFLGHCCPREEPTHVRLPFYWLFSFFLSIDQLTDWLIDWSHHAACRILVLQRGTEPTPPAVEVQSLNHLDHQGSPSQGLLLTGGFF